VRPPASQLTSGQRHGGVLGVDGVQDPLVADLGLRHQADLAAQIGRPSAHRGVLYPTVLSDTIIQIRKKITCKKTWSNIAAATTLSLFPRLLLRATVLAHSTQHGYLLPLRSRRSAHRGGVHRTAQYRAFTLRPGKPELHVIEKTPSCCLFYCRCGAKNKNNDNIK